MVLHKTRLIMACVAVCWLQTVLATEPIPVEGGLVSGHMATNHSGIFCFKGIPFAAPPTGKLRWQPPQPVKPWKGIRECSTFGPVCPQPKGLSFMKQNTDQSEDCLYLNIWTPSLDASANLPVMVWIHGGGFTIGAGSQNNYNGAGLAEKGVVLVTINYRLGPFGFLAHPQLSKESANSVSGNYGLLDQIAALKWVKNNIAKFGGNPENVTIFGESAGSVSCACLLVSPLAKGLFQRAILESGTATGIQQQLHDGEDSAEKQGADLQALLKAESLAALRNLPAQAILKAETIKVGLLGKGRKYWPIIDGYVIPDQPTQLMREGKFSHVPVIIGTNDDEGTLFGQQIRMNNRFIYKLLVRRWFGNDATKVLSHFDFDRADNPKKLFLKILTHAAFITPAKMTAESLAAHQPDVFYYHFTRTPAVSGMLGLGATHGLEIAYVFGTGKLVLRDKRDLALSNAIQAYWVAFARNGNPNNEELPTWPAYTTPTDHYLELGDTVSAKQGLYPKEYQLFRKLTEKKLSLTPESARK